MDTPSLPDFVAMAEQGLRDGQFDGADHALSRALALDPAAAPPLCLAGLLAHRRGRSGDALRWFGRTARLRPDNPTARSGLSEELRRAGRLEAASVHGRIAAALEPGDVHALHNLGIISYDRLEIGRAIRCNRRAMRLVPDMPGPHFELAEALLLSGRFEEGWAEYEWRFRLPHAPPPIPAPLLEARGPVRPSGWDGRPMPDGGRLLLVADQGFGDAIQFARYLPQVERICPNLVVACSAELVPVLGQLVSGGRLHQDWNALPDFQAWCPLSGLPRLFGTCLETVPATVPYLQPAPEATARWRRRLAELVPHGYRRIGLVWAGRSTHGNDHNRSMSLHQLAPLFDAEKTAFLSLQIGPAQLEIGRCFGAAPLVNLGPEIADFGDSMAILHGLDHLVSVDTAVAHLAGAMAVPTALLLPFAPDWRWLLGRGDTPWYPTMTLHRQREPGRWDAPLHDIGTLLRTAPRG